jgi:hypothetical protein
MEWFYSLPIYAQLPIIITIIFSIIIISVYGGIKIQKSKDDISINIGGGKTESKDKNKERNKEVINNVKIRKCEDCVMILRDHFLKVERTIRSLEEAKFSKPLNYIEQKLEEFSSLLIEDYLNEINKQATDTDKSTGETIKQLRLFEAHLEDACGRIKMEIRRALRENGFCKLSSKELNCYINSEIIRIIDIIPHHIRSVYPSNSSCMIIDMNEVLGLYNNRKDDLASIIQDFFVTTTDMINQIDKERKVLEEESNKWCYNFITNKESLLTSI